MAIPRYKTAMSRKDLSRPVKLALAKGVLQPEDTVFDYGAGRGGDVQRLVAQGFKAAGYDYHFSPNNPLKESDVVFMSYVLNVIEDPVERAEVLKKAWKLAKKAFVVAARTTGEASGLKGAEPYGDGVITSSGSFQKFYTQSELLGLVKFLGGRVESLGQGVVVVYRNALGEHVFAKGSGRLEEARRPYAKEWASKVKKWKKWLAGFEALVGEGKAFRGSNRQYYDALKASLKEGKGLYSKLEFELYSTIMRRLSDKVQAGAGKQQAKDLYIQVEADFKENKGEDLFYELNKLLDGALSRWTGARPRIDIQEYQLDLDIVGQLIRRPWLQEMDEDVDEWGKILSPLIVFLDEGLQVQRFEGLLNQLRGMERLLEGFSLGSGKLLYHTTSMGVLEKILESRVLRPKNYDSVVSFSEIPFMGDISGNDATLVFNAAKMPQVEKVVYTKAWYDDNPELAGYVAGEGWREQYEPPEWLYEPPEDWDEEEDGDWEPDSDDEAAAYREAELFAFLDKSNEKEWLTTEMGEPVRFRDDALVAILVERRMVEAVQDLVDELGLEVEVKAR